MTTLYLVRHGRSEGNAAQRIQGWLDSPLDALGLRQARALGERFHNKPLAALYTSPLVRAAETARAIADARGILMIVDERLREYQMGAWTGLTEGEINAMMPPARGESHDPIGPGGESGLEMRHRISAFMAEMPIRHPHQMVVVVCHGGTIGAMVSLTLGMQPIRRQPFAFGNASITKLRYERGRWRLRSLNDRCHLRTLTSIDVA